MKTSLSALLAGLLFSLGLGLGGMTDPTRVRAFLDVTGNWDASLAFVMAGALGTHALSRRFIVRRSKPVLAAAFPTASHAKVDRRLLVGAALFGAGWGLSGYCPGPALTSLASGASTALTFVASMFGGMLVFRLWERARAAEGARENSIVPSSTSPKRSVSRSSA